MLSDDRVLPGHSEAEEARLAELREYARELAASAPPLTPIQRAELAAILVP